MYIPRNLPAERTMFRIFQNDTTPATAGYVLRRGMLRPLLYGVCSTLSGVTGTLLRGLAERSKV